MIFCYNTLQLFHNNRFMYKILHSNLKTLFNHIPTLISTNRNNLYIRMPIPHHLSAINLVPPFSPKILNLQNLFSSQYAIANRHLNIHQNQSKFVHFTLFIRTMTHQSLLEKTDRLRTIFTCKNLKN